MIAALNNLHIGQRFAGFFLWLLLTPIGVLGLLILPVLIILAPITIARNAMRAYDQFGNATVFGGSPYETISSHSWRSRANPVFGFIVWLLDLIQQGHCEQANKNEQLIINLINSQP